MVEDEKWLQDEELNWQVQEVQQQVVRMKTAAKMNFPAATII